VNNYERVMMFK